VAQAGGREVIRVREFIFADSEFSHPKGERPERSSCFVAYEERSRKTIRAVRPGIGCRLPQGVVEYGSEPPWAHGPNDLFSAFSVGAEMGSYFNEGWPYPANIICTFAEIMTYHNVRLCKAGEGSKEVPGLIDALKYYKLPTIGAETKSEMRKLAIRGPPFTYEELVALIEYCELDMMACRRLFWAMLKRGHIDLLRAPIRGAFMARLARVEWNGIPIDPNMRQLIEEHFPTIVPDLLDEANRHYGKPIFIGKTLRAAPTYALIAERDCAMGRPVQYPIDRKTGKRSLAKEPLKELAQRDDYFEPLRELNKTLAHMKQANLIVGSDNRNRTWQQPFKSKTGRNQPSNSKHIMGFPKPYRCLIQPPPGYALGVIDFASQEFGIGARLSGDAAMQTDYQKEDPYLGFARAAFGVTAFPEDGGAMRKKCKESVLGGMYGLGAEGLAYKHGISVAEARDLQAMVPRIYPVFDEWLRRVLNKARMGKTIYAALGWPIEIKGFDDRRGTYLNFPMQANGAEIMRLTTIYIIDNALELCAIIHDAFMILSPADRIEDDVLSLRECMRRSSRVVLRGFELRLDPKVILHPHRYEADERSRQQWDDLIRRAERREQQKWKS
jgi:DNA polymerase I